MKNNQSSKKKKSGIWGIARQGIYPAIVYVEIDILKDNLGNKGIVLWIS